MTRSRWICNNCGEEFDRKGKRDNHREKEHRDKVMIILSGQEEEITRSENGKFVCVCGKQISHVRSLKRHRIGCNTSILAIENESRTSENEEGMRQFSGWMKSEIDLMSFIV
jgi:hypothetical protein